MANRIVSYPSRWSLLFIFGFMWWSSSWQWLPHIAGGKMFTSLLRAGLTVLVQFFCKMYILWVSWSRNFFWQTFFEFYPPKRDVFSKGGQNVRMGGWPISLSSPLFWHFFPSAYRGSPPCTLSRHPNIRERHGTAMYYTNTGCQVLNLHRAQFLPHFGHQPSGALCRARERGELIRYSGAIQVWWVMRLVGGTLP